MAITGKRIFHDGEKFVGKYRGKIYHAVPTATKDGLRFIVNGSKTEHRTLSGAGATVFGLNKEGKPRTCNGFAFWSRAEVTASAGTTKSKAPAKKATAKPKKVAAKKPAAKKPTAKKASTKPVVEARGA